MSFHLRIPSSPMWRSTGLALHLAAPIARFRPQDKVAPCADPLQAFLDSALVKYVQEGVGELNDAKLPDLLERKYHSVHDAVSFCASGSW